MGKKEKLREQPAGLPGGVDVPKAVAPTQRSPRRRPAARDAADDASSELAALRGRAQSRPELAERLTSVYRSHRIWKLSL